MWIATVFEGYLIMIVGSFGILGNFFFVVFFMTLKEKLNFHRLMITLAVFDTIYIILSMLEFSLPELSEDYQKKGYHFYLAPLAVPVMQIALTGSVYCTVSISIERYLTVCHPFYIAGKDWPAKLYILPIIIFSVLYNVSRFFEMRIKYNFPNSESINNNHTTPGGNKLLEGMDSPAIFDNNISSVGETKNNYPNSSFQNPSLYEKINHSVMEPPSNDTSQYDVELTGLRANKYYYSIYIIGLNLLCNGLVPFIIIITLNTLIYNRLKLIVISHSFKSRADSFAFSMRRERSFRTDISSSLYKTRRVKFSEIMLAKVAIAIVFVLISCHSVRWIPNLYELVQRLRTEEEKIEWPSWVEENTHISHFMTVLSSSLNFYIYIITHHGCLPSFNVCLGNRQKSSDLEL